jgi:hypothetical protein
MKIDGVIELKDECQLNDINTTMPGVATFYCTLSRTMKLTGKLRRRQYALRKRLTGRFWLARRYLEEYREFEMHALISLN